MCSLSLRGWWIDGIGIDDFRTSPLCKQDSLFRLLSPEYSQHDIPPHQSGPDNWRFDRTLVVTPFVKTGICVQWKNSKVHAFLPSVHANALTVPARVEIKYFKQLKNTIFACKWIALRNNWWSWSVSPKITFKEKTRLTYNCAHLRLTKESQIVEIREKGGKYLTKKNICCEGK